MRERMSSSCVRFSVLLSSLAKWKAATVDGSKCGLTKAAARAIATCEWMSIVVLFGLTSRPGLPCLRAAVAAYLFHGVVMLAVAPLCSIAVAHYVLEHAE